MSDNDGSLFSQHLFSRDIFGGNPMRVFQDRPMLYRTGVHGRQEYVGDWGKKVDAYPFVLTDAEAKRILRAYGPGSYRLVYVDSDGRDRAALFDVVAAKSLPPSPRVPVKLSSDFMKRVPLHQLSSMLLSAGPPFSASLGRSIADGWMSTLNIGSPDAASFGDDGADLRPEHPWLRLLPTFYERSDTEIYRAYVDDSLIVDRDDIREYVLDGISRVRTLCERLSTMNAAHVSQHRGTWYLWLDDERNPSVVLAEDNGETCLGARYKQFVEAGLIGAPWRWARSVEQAIWMVEAYGHPAVMSLDHDLGGASTAMSFVRWMADEGQHIPKWYLHSANPVGRASLASFLQSWERQCPTAADVAAKLADGVDALRDLVSLDAAADAADDVDGAEMGEREPTATELEDSVEADHDDIRRGV